MTTDSSFEKILFRDAGDSAGISRTGRGLISGTLPPDLLAEAVQRLRIIALLYAFIYLLAGFLPALLIPQRAEFFSDPKHWLPGVMSIVAALTVAGLTLLGGLSPVAKMRIGLVFEVLGSFGIAAAEYSGISAPIEYGAIDMGYGGFGLSWVSVWVILFTVAVPTPLLLAVLAALLSVSAVPLTFHIGTTLGVNTAELAPSQFFFTLVFPNLLVVIMASVGARVVYRLGAAVRQAREMGSYRLVERLGAGGMGEVWRAEHRMLARPAAIKLIRPEVIGGTDVESRHVMLRRFEREAQATALMQSPHTMEVYDFGVADDGTFYYVMELLDGFDLDNLIQQFGPVPPERAVQFVTQMCDSLSEAHTAGLIHRDIKPANVFACRYARQVDFVKVLDFGLVKHSPGIVTNEEKLTADFHVAGGTPAYISPEQAMGAQSLDARSDIYAVGCVAYWLLTGSIVFRGRTPMETISMHINAAPEPPSRVSKLAISAELDAAVLACLAKDPDQRPQTADELCARLLEVPCAETWTDERAREWWAEHVPAQRSAEVASLASSPS